MEDLTLKILQDIQSRLTRIEDTVTDTRQRMAILEGHVALLVQSDVDRAAV